MEPVEVDPKFAKVIDPSAPPPMRMMAARGIVPGATPRDLLAIQYALTLDADSAIAKAAATALGGTPANLLKGAIDSKTHAGVIDLVARTRMQDEDLLEFLVLRKQISDDTLVFVAEQSRSLKIVEIVGKNQERLLQAPQILDALKKNPVTPKSLIDVTVAFLQMSGVLPTGVEAKVAGLPEEVSPALVQEVIGDETFSPEMTSDDAAPASEEKKLSLLQRLAAMTVSQKVKLAYRANKEVRQILVRETNKIVVGAVLNSGRLTDGEVIALSKSRQVSSDVLRAIAKNRDWCKNYEIQLGLVSNPKTPQAIAVAMIKNVKLADLGLLAKNPNIPGVVKTMARQLYTQKSGNR